MQKKRIKEQSCNKQSLFKLILIFGIVLLSLNFVSAWSNNTLLIYPNNVYSENYTGYDSGIFSTRTGLFEYCTKISTQGNSKLRIQFFVDYTGTYNFLPFGIIRIRNLSNDTLEEINDINRDMIIITNSNYSGNIYWFCLTNTNSIGTRKIYEQYSTNYPIQTITGTPINIGAAFNISNYNFFSIEDLTFQDNQNLTRYLSIPQNTILTNAYLNLSGFDSYLNDIYQSTYGCEGTFRDGFECIYAVDSDWSTGSTANYNEHINVTENFTIPSIKKYINWTVKVFDNNAFIFIALVYWNNTKNDWESFCSDCVVGSGGMTNLTFTIPNDGVNNTILRTKVYVKNAASNSGMYYNSKINIKVNDSLNNSYINVGNNQIWYYPNIFNQSNNKTSNLANTIDSYLSSCSYSGGFCYVPFIFHSDSAGILQYSDLIFNNYGFLENSQTFNSITIPNSIENFLINITYNPNFYTSVSGNLTYNGISYSGNIISGNYLLINRILTIPSITSQTNYIFYWNISLTNSSGTYYLISTTQNQTVNPVLISICNSTYNVTYVNFTTKDVETNNILNSIFKITLSIGNYNYSYQDTVEDNSSYAFCFSPNNTNYTVNSKIEYEATKYSKNYYYFNDAKLTNTSTNISLYLLNSSKADLTVLRVYDGTHNAISDVYISIERYNVGTDTFYTVGMAKTDYEGKDLAYLNWYDTFYRFILSKNNEVMLMSGTTKISESPKDFQILESIVFEYDKFDDIFYNLYNTSDTIILTYTLPSGEITAACLRVLKRDPLKDTIICNTCETSQSATIYCSIAGYGNGTFIGMFYAKGSYAWVDAITIIKVANQIYELLGNTDASIYAFLFAGIVAMMFLITPVLGIVGVILGTLGGMVIGFQPYNYGEFLGVVIAGLVIIWILKR